MWYYLLGINVIAVVIFIYDKLAATQGKRRIPEFTLHLLELLGGVFGIVCTMLLIHHKNKKASYYIYTIVIAIAWLCLLYYLLF